MNELHDLLARQIEKTYDEDIENLSKTTQEFIQKVERSYENFDEDRKMLERSLELTSDELVETNKELRQTLNEVEREAKYDSVTGLPNRNHFNEKLDEIINNETAEPATIVFMDLDGFKELNDAYGHSFGDVVLDRLASLLEGHVRDDDFLARWGGDEFVLLIKNGKKDEIEERLDSICEVFSDSFEFQQQICHLDISMGVTIYPEDGEVADNLLSKADMAMYEAKNRQSTSYQFYVDGEIDRLKEKINIKNDLRETLNKDSIRVHYQPRIDSETCEIIGYEALARWKHPEEGFIPPGEFIPVAESTGLIVELENQIVRQVSNQLKKWLEQRNWQPKISLNLSSQHLQQEGLANWIKDVLSKHQIDPSLIEVEITETGLLPQIDSTLTILNNLKATGIKIAVDDFGTGYSSLEYLMSLPIDTLKIDYSFVHNINDDNSSLELVKMIHFVSQKLDLNVVAEGVETQEEYKIIKQYSDEIQGFLFSKPKSPAEIEDDPPLFKPENSAIA